MAIEIYARIEDLTRPTLTIEWSVSTNSDRDEAPIRWRARLFGFKLQYL